MLIYVFYDYSHLLCVCIYTSSIICAVLYLVGIFTVGALFQAIRSGLFTVAGERVVARLRKDVFAAILKQDIAWFDQSKTGELTNRVSADCAVIQNTATVNISMALRLSLQIVGALFILLFLSWRLTLVMMGVTPAVVITAVIYGKARFKLPLYHCLANHRLISNVPFHAVCS